MLTGRAIRHQMILPEQQFVFDYWRSKSLGGCLPRRADIEPMDIYKYLPMISMLDIDICSKSESRRFNYRLAGTGFWDIYNQEITGLYIDELPIGDTAVYWHRVLNRVSTLKRPSAGVTKPKTPNKSHLAQFWIRLPLSDDGENVTTILGFDHLVRMGDMPALLEAGQRSALA